MRIDPETGLYPNESRCSVCYSIYYSDSSCQNCKSFIESHTPNPHDDLALESPYHGIHGDVCPACHEPNFVQQGLSQKWECANCGYYEEI